MSFFWPSENSHLLALTVCFVRRCEKNFSEAGKITLRIEAPRCRCRTVSEPGQKANERLEAIEQRSVSGEADWGGQKPHSGCAERPKRAALPPQSGQRRLRLTRLGWRARLSA